MQPHYPKFNKALCGCIYLQVQFQIADSSTHILTPRLLDGLEVPDKLSIFGFPIDLTPLQNVLNPVNDAILEVKPTLCPSCLHSVDTV